MLPRDHDADVRSMVADLFRTYSYFQPDEPGEDSGRPIIAWIIGNTYEHYDEHRAWIEELIAR